MKLKVTTTDEEVLGWVRRITIKDEDHNEFRCRLSWHEGNGYEIDWYGDEPEFYTNWDDEAESMFFEQWLDEESC
jgi:hypothetical protein